MPILGAVTCNKVIFPQLKAALAGHPRPRPGRQDPPRASTPAATTRGSSPAPSTLSNHAFGLALDLNAVENQRGTVGQIDRGVVAIFEKWGFTWGGDWGYTDPMHFELNSIRTPTPESAATS